MAWSFNPFTGNLDLVGGGAVVFEGEVETFADLPETVGDPAVGASFLVRSSTGVWLVNKRQSGIWIRRNNTGVRATDWEYGGDYPVNSVAGKTGNVTLTNSDISGLGSAATANLNAISDADFRLIGSTDATKKVAIEVDSLVSAGTTRTLTVPNGDATIAATPVSRLQQFFSSQTYNVVEGLNVDIELQNPVGSCAIVVVLPRLTTDGARSGDEILLRPTSLGSGSSYTLQRYVWTGGGYIGSTETITTMEVGQTYRLRLVGGVWTLLVTPNLASPPAIGSTTRNTGAFTTLSANNGTITASAPVLDLSQTWNNAAVTFTGLRFNVTNTASATASQIIDLQVGGTSAFRIRRDGATVIPFSTNGPTTVGRGFGSGINATHGLWCESGRVGLTAGNDYQFTVTTTGATVLSELRVGDQGCILRSENSAANQAGVILAQRNGTNPQEYRLYNTYSSSGANHERGFMRWNANRLDFGTEAAGTGTARSVAILAGANTYTFFNNGEGVSPLSWVVPAGGTFRFDSRARITSPADSVLLIRNNAGDDFNRLQFGGTTSSFPALKRSSTTLQVRLADDSADAPFSSGAITTSGTVTANNTSSGFVTSSAPNGASPVRFAANTGDVLIQSANAAGIVEFRGITGTNPQSLRVFNTFTSGTSFERLNIRWASNECIIDAEAGSGGGTLRGIKIGSATSSLLGFYGATPVSQRAAIADATDAATTQARLNDLLAAMRSLGLIAT